MANKNNPGLSLPYSTNKSLITSAIKSPNCELPVHKENTIPFSKYLDKI